MTEIFNVLVVYPPSYDASQSMFDVACGFSESLKKLGHEAELTIDPTAVHPAGTTLVFGAHLVPKFGGALEGGDYIIYQLEQVPADGAYNEWITPGYIDILKRYPVWDYSPLNIENLKAHGVDAKYVPIGYSPCMSNFHKSESACVSGKSRIEYKEWTGIRYDVMDCDVMFVGGMNPRRQKIVDELRGRGHVVTTPVGFGGWRDKTIARAKILLNIHYFDTAIFEIERVSHYWANSKCVVSEIGKDSNLEFQYYGSTPFVKYDDIVPTVERILTNPDERKGYEKSGFEVFSKQLLADTLRKVLV